MRLMRLIKGLLLGYLVTIGSLAVAEEATVEVFSITGDNEGQSIGQIQIQDTEYGLLFTPELDSLSQGAHGFHVHELPSCANLQKDGKLVSGLGAGGHFDPQGTNKHEGPYGKGHLGDLPPIFADANGQVKIPVLAPRLKLSDIRGRSIIIHAGADNYSDKPKSLGGGGPRVACTVVTR